MTTTTSGDANRAPHGNRPEPEDHDVPETPTDPSAMVEAFLKAFVRKDFDAAPTHVADHFDLLTAGKMHDPAAV